jgi:hypothetical protein
MDSGTIAAQIANYDKTPVTSVDALNSALGTYGVPEIRSRVSGLRTTLQNTENSLNAVDPSVTGRTSGSLVTEAQREKQVTNERAPIAQQYGQQQQALTGESANLADATSNAEKIASAKVSDYNTGRASLVNRYDTQYKREQDQIANDRAAAAAKAAAAGSGGIDYGSLFGGGGAAGGTPAAGNPATAGATQRVNDKGFNYTDGNGNSINAAQYAHLTGQSFRAVLQRAAGAGDAGSKAALNFVGDDYGYDPTKITSPAMANLYKALTGKSANVYTSPKQIAATTASNNIKTLVPSVQDAKNKGIGYAIGQQLTHPSRWW